MSKKHLFFSIFPFKIIHPFAGSSPAWWKSKKNEGEKMLTVSYNYECPLCRHGFFKGPYHDFIEELEESKEECPICRIPESASFPEVESEWSA